MLEKTTYPNSVEIARSNDWRGRIDTLERSSTTLVDYAYVGSRVAQRSYGVPSVDYEPTYDNLGRITEMDYGASIVNFDYTYVADENNIERKTFDHRTNDEYNQYAYDDLDRVSDVDYLVYNSTPDHEETFNMDTLGNRTSVVRDTSTDTYALDSATNRYDVATSGYDVICEYDEAGNTTKDKDDYTYEYDYENRIVKIEDSSSVEVATHDYDALGRRIRVIDKSADPDVTTLYYYNPEWQVLAEYNGSNELQRYYVYGNYIDEPLVMSDGTDDYYYAQDHLYSTVALIGYVDTAWTVVERYEYNAYGKVQIMSSAFVDRSSSSYSNPYTFTGRRLDTLDSGDYEIMYYRNRYYDPYTGRFLTNDPMGVNPADGKQNPLKILMQYSDGLNLHQYAKSSSINYVDPSGLVCSVLVKRVKANLKPQSSADKRYGHEWIVVGSTQSYGWWPKDPVTGNAIIDAIFGVEGDINSGLPNDPYHLEVGDTTWETKMEVTSWFIFAKKLEAGSKKGTKCCKATCSDITDCLNSFAGDYAGKWSLLRSCRTFSQEALAACCLKKGEKSTKTKTYTGTLP